MSWLWGEKKSKVPLKFNTRNSNDNYVRQNIKVSINFDIEYPQNTDIIKVIQEIQATFDLPEGVQILGADITNIELLGKTK